MISKKLSAFIVIFAALIFGCYLFGNAKRLVPVSANILSGKTVVIDAGHGMPDGGAVAQDGTKESEINLKIAKELKKLLEKGGVKVIMTRNNENSLSKLKKGNKTDDMKKRVAIRNDSGGDIFVSIHLNHFSQSQYRGAQVFYNPSNEENAVLAGGIQSKLIELADPNNTRSIKSTDTLYILNGCQIPSVLVECGFLSNADEAQLLATEKYQKTISKAIYLGICEYLTKN